MSDLSRRSDWPYSTITLWLLRVFMFLPVINLSVCLMIRELNFWFSACFTLQIPQMLFLESLKLILFLTIFFLCWSSKLIAWTTLQFAWSYMAFSEVLCDPDKRSLFTKDRAPIPAYHRAWCIFSAYQLSPHLAVSTTMLHYRVMLCFLSLSQRISESLYAFQSAQYPICITAFSAPLLQGFLGGVVSIMFGCLGLLQGLLQVLLFL